MDEEVYQRLNKKIRAIAWGWLSRNFFSGREYLMEDCTNSAWESVIRNGIDNERINFIILNAIMSEVNYYRRGTKKCGRGTEFNIELFANYVDIITSPNDPEDIVVNRDLIEKIASEIKRAENVRKRGPVKTLQVWKALVLDYHVGLSRGMVTPEVAGKLKIGNRAIHNGKEKLRNLAKEISTRL